MSEPRRPSLFDLPLEATEEQRDESAPEEPRAPRRDSRKRPPASPATPAAGTPRPDEGLPLFPDEPLPPAEPLPPDEDKPDEGRPSPQSHAPRRPAAEPADSQESPPRSPAPMPASLGARWRAGSLDLLLHAALALVLAFGSWLLGAPLEGVEILGLAVFVAVFSFLYTVIPLAFWGRTPGMKRAGLVASGGDREASALTFGQTALRWLGGLLTLSLLGFPSLLALVGGRSLTDRLSGSRTWRLPRSGDG